MIYSLRQKPERTKKALAVAGAFVVTSLCATLWIVTFDSRGLAEGAEGARESLKQLGVGVQNQIEIYKTQTSGQNLESPSRYQAADEQLPPDELQEDSSFGPDDSGVEQAEADTSEPGVPSSGRIQSDMKVDSTSSQAVEQTIY